MEKVRRRCKWENTWFLPLGLQRYEAQSCHTEVNSCFGIDFYVLNQCFSSSRAWPQDGQERQSGSCEVLRMLLQSKAKKISLPHTLTFRSQVLSVSLLKHTQVNSVGLPVSSLTDSLVLQFMEGGHDIFWLWRRTHLTEKVQKHWAIFRLYTHPWARGDCETEPPQE